MIVLDAGGGHDSTYWACFAPDLAERMGLKVITYDRASMGGSDEVKGPCTLRQRQRILRLTARAWRDRGRHSGIPFHGRPDSDLSDNKAASWFKGVVLLDANVPDFFTDEIVTAMNAEFAPMVAALTSAPSTRENRQLLAAAASFDEVSRTFHKAVWPVSIPLVVIGSEQTPFGDGPVGDA